MYPSLNSSLAAKGMHRLWGSGWPSHAHHYESVPFPAPAMCVCTAQARKDTNKRTSGMPPKVTCHAWNPETPLDLPHLGDDGQLAAQGIQPDAAGVHAVQQDAA